MTKEGAATPPTSEAAMAEIMDSIKQIVKEGQAEGSQAAPTSGEAKPVSEASAPAAPPATTETSQAESDQDDALELTELVEDEEDEAAGSLIGAVGLAPLAAAASPPVAAPPVSRSANQAVVSKLQGLKQATEVAKQIGSGSDGAGGRIDSNVMRIITPLAETWVRQNMPRLSERTIEDSIRPLLQDWLDENLSEIVERIVREEVSKLVAQASKD
ncbi:MAG: hypothetical protein Kilf2KO_39310 [Rhodospirillales bacterium]